MEPNSELAELRAAVEKLAQRVARLESGAPQKPASVAAALPTQEVPAAHAAETVPSSVLPAAIAPAAPQPDLESRIGSHWLNRIGITALLTGVAYFLKLAFDND